MRRAHISAADPIFARVYRGRGNRFQLVAIDVRDVHNLPGMSGSLKSAGYEHGDIVEVRLVKRPS